MTEGLRGEVTVGSYLHGWPEWGFVLGLILELILDIRGVTLGFHIWYNTNSTLHPLNIFYIHYKHCYYNTLLQHIIQHML